MRQWTGLALVQIIACHMSGAKASSDLLLIGPLETSFNEIRIKIQRFSLIKMHLEMSSAKWRPFCPRGWVEAVLSTTWLPSASRQLQILRTSSLTGFGFYPTYELYFGLATFSACIYFWSKVNIWNVNCARATAFIFDLWTDVLVKVSEI